MSFRISEIFNYIYLKGNFVELKIFVKETIKEIIEGIVEVQKELVPTLDVASHGYFQIGSESYSEIEFDISVTSSESEGSEKKAGVFIKVVDLGVKNNSTNNNSSTNKIKFKVPVIFPMKANKKFS